MDEAEPESIAPERSVERHGIRKGPRGTETSNELTSEDTRELTKDIECHFVADFEKVKGIKSNITEPTCGPHSEVHDRTCKYTLEDKHAAPYDVPRPKVRKDPTCEDKHKNAASDTY